MSLQEKLTLLLEVLNDGFESCANEHHRGTSKLATRLLLRNVCTVCDSVSLALVGVCVCGNRGKIECREETRLRGTAHFRHIV